MSDDPIEREDYLYALMRGRADPEGLGHTVKPGVVDIGHDTRIMFQTRVDSTVPVGLIESHPTADGYGCSGSVIFDVPEAEGLKGARWTVESLDPLTISPSVLCRACGWHGFIRGGRWEPC